MNPTNLSPAFETKHYVYGTYVSRMTADQLTQSINAFLQETEVNLSESNARTEIEV